LNRVRAAFSLALILCAGSITLAPNARAQAAPQTAAPQNAASQDAAPESKPASPPSYQITGSVHSGKTPLPGVAVTAANTLTGKKFSVVTASDGTFVFGGIPRGRYVVRAEFMGFAVATQEVVLNPENASAKVVVEMLLASRQQQQTDVVSSALTAAGRGFQSLALDSTLSALAGAGGTAAAGGTPSSPGDISSLPLESASNDQPNR
jgi:hypothetical protein